MAAKNSVLLVEDDPDIAEMLCLGIKAEGHEVVTASDGAGALQLTASKLPEVICIDLMMPGMSGFELAEKIRAAPWGQDIRLIACSGLGEPEAVERAHSVGFDAYFLKPIEFDELLRHIERGRRDVHHPTWDVVGFPQNRT